MNNKSIVQKLIVKRSMLIADVVKKYPQIVEVFASYGLSCAGCNVSTIESIEEGSYRHGMDDELIEMMLRDANKIASIVKKSKPSKIKLGPKVCGCHH